MQPGQTSTTARRVAHHRLSLARVATPYGRPGDDDRLQADVAGELDLAPSPMARYFQARTTWFDRAVVAALADGLTQVVAVGAGYDGRSLRYAKAGVDWFELDHPDTQRDKLARLDRLGLVADDVTFAAADFGLDDVAAALVRVDLDTAEPTLFTCEGVAAYLDDRVRADLLGALGRVAGPGSRMAVEIALEPRTDDERDRRARLRSAVGGMGEPMPAPVPLDGLEPLLTHAGWRLVTATDPGGVPIRESSRSTAFVVAVPAGDP
jgi:methyltransferase (TIGR00027 family)